MVIADCQLPIYEEKTRKEIGNWQSAIGNYMNFASRFATNAS